MGGKINTLNEGIFSNEELASFGVKINETDKSLTKKPIFSDAELLEIGISPSTVKSIHKEAKENNSTLRTDIDKETLLQNEIEKVKNIDLNFKIEFPSWNEFKKDNLEKAKEKGLTGEKLKTFEKFLESSVYPMYINIVRIKNEISADKIGQHLNDILDEVENSEEGPNGGISIDLNDLSISEEIKIILSNLFLKIQGEKPNKQIKYGVINFPSKEEAVNAIGLVKNNLNEYEPLELGKAFIQIIEGALESTLGTVLGWTTLGLYNLEMLWLKTLALGVGKLGKLTIEAPILGGLAIAGIYGTAFYFNDAVMKKIKTGESTELFNKIDKQVDETIRLYSKEVKQTPEIKEKVKKLKDLKKKMSGFHNDLKGGHKDNYKLMKDYYMLLNSFQDNGFFNFSNKFNAILGGYMDNGNLHSGLDWDYLKKNPGKGFLKIGVDTLIFPFKFTSVFLNKGPNGWKWDWNGKGGVLNDFNDAFEKSNQKFKHIFSVIDSFSDSELTSEQKAQLKADILNEYDLSKKGGSVSPLHKNKINIDIKDSNGKFKIPTYTKVDFDEKVSERIEKLLKDKYGKVFNEDGRVKDFLSALDNDFGSIENSRDEIEKRKIIFDDFIKYHPEINGATEQKLLNLIQASGNLSIDEIKFTDEFKKILSTININIADYEEIKKISNNFRNNSIDIGSKRNELRKIFNDVLSKLELSQDEITQRRKIFNTNIINSKNTTFWEPHLVYILDQAAHGVHIDTEIDTYTIKQIDNFTKSSGLENLEDYKYSRKNQIEINDSNKLKKIERYLKNASLYGDRELVFDLLEAKENYLKDGTFILTDIEEDFKNKGYEILDERTLESEIKNMEKAKAKMKGKGFKFTDIDLKNLERDFGKKTYIKSLFDNLKKANIS